MVVMSEMLCSMVAVEFGMVGATRATGADKPLR